MTSNVRNSAAIEQASGEKLQIKPSKPCLEEFLLDQVSPAPKGKMLYDLYDLYAWQLRGYSVSWEIVLRISRRRSGRVFLSSHKE